MMQNMIHSIYQLFNFPQALPWCIGGVVVGSLLIVWKYRKTRATYTTISSSAWRSWLIQGSFGWRPVLKYSLYILGLSSLACAVLEPQWGQAEQVVQQEGRDVFIAIDVSRSMLAGDITPNRLEAVKTKVKKLLYNLSCERVGLILFSGTSIVQCPLTVDYSLFLLYLDQIDVETISSGSTALDKPISQALDTFKKVGGSKTKLLLLFTDGEDFAGNVDHLLEQVKQEHVIVASVGVGTEQGAPVPIIQQDGTVKGFEKEKDGSIILTKLDPGLLKKIAQVTGGIYVPFDAHGHGDISQLISFVQTFEKGQYGEKSSKHAIAQYPYFVGVSLVSFALEWLL